ncbi:hypothetical protein K466DRAFT_605290 [Polyporus arcularius HHB13444]|uniref:NAD-dependent epimerase/dehydratase domain-containing protein n=1 Tax=Polyporus arcularius HHB13444 TaxID=1314778 RepID=A0A5C3NVV8_9APHY|nr:hypothetical protein K466DRAFT_605290 [Polyporus arcularius HHB13444]
MDFGGPGSTSSQLFAGALRPPQKPKASRQLPAMVRVTEHLFLFRAARLSAAVLDPSHKDAFTGITFTEKNYGQATPEDLINGNHNPLYTYCGTKILAEQAAWKFAEEHREIDLATINPPFLYGAYAVNPGQGPASLGSNILLYQLITGKPGRPLPPQVPPAYCHVSDAERAHLLALTLPKLPAGADSETMRYIAERHPELGGRLPTLEDAPPLPGPLSTTDTTRAREVLGVTEYVGLAETVEETIQALLELEKSWK